MNDLRIQGAKDLQAYFDELLVPYGATISARTPDSKDIVIPAAGIRVLEATPIFDRSTGVVSQWRYAILFFEMSALDVHHCGHSAHLVRGLMVEQRPNYYCVVREDDYDRTFLFSKNDPHHVQDGQQELYDWWAQQIANAGGAAKVEAQFDTIAREWAEEMRVLSK